MGIKNEVESNCGARACRWTFLFGKRENYLPCVKCAAENYFLKAAIYRFHERNDRSRRARTLLFWEVKPNTRRKKCNLDKRNQRMRAVIFAYLKRIRGGSRTISKPKWFSEFLDNVGIINPDIITRIPRSWNIPSWRSPSPCRGSSRWRYRFVIVRHCIPLSVSFRWPASTSNCQWLLRKWVAQLPGKFAKKVAISPWITEDRQEDTRVYSRSRFGSLAAYKFTRTRSLSTIARRIRRTDVYSLGNPPRNFISSVWDRVMHAW